MDGQRKISLENLLVVTDDLNIDFGTIRLKAKGSDGGHNGLKDIQEKLNTNNIHVLDLELVVIIVKEDK